MQLMDAYKHVEYCMGKYCICRYSYCIDIVQWYAYIIACTAYSCRRLNECMVGEWVQDTQTEGGDIAYMHTI